MRILQLAQFFPPVIGGEERHVRNLSVALAERGHDVHVGCFDVGGEREQPAGVTVHHLDNLGRRFPSLYPSSERPLAFPFPDPTVTRALGALVREVRPDVVHAHNWIVNSYLPLSAARRLPLVYSLHDYSHVCATKRFLYEGEPCSGPGPAKCLGCASRHYGRGRGQAIATAVGAGRPVRDRLIDLYTPVSRAVARGNRLDALGVRWEHVPNFVPDRLTTLPDLPRDPALPEGDYLFFAGDLSKDKGLPTLLRAYARLDPATRPALVAVGRRHDGLPEELPDGVTIGEAWAHDRVLSGFQHALAAALPSEWPDPCPTTVLEAMAVGAPLVTTHLGGIADMVVDGESALVSRPGDVADLAAALQRLATEPELRARLRAGARTAVGGFLQSAVAARVEGLYAGLGRSG